MTTNLSGSLSEFSLAEVLSLLGMGGRTARMQVSTADSVGMVHLVDGQVCAATSDCGRAGLLRAVVAALPVPADDLAHAVHEVAPVRALVESGVLDREAARDVAADHCTEAVGQMLSWAEGDFAVWVGVEDLADIGVRLSVDDLVGAAKRRAQEWRDLRAALPEADSVLALNPDPDQPPAVDVADWAVLARVDGRRTLSEVLAAMGASPLASGGRLVRLMGRGLVVVSAGDRDAEAERADLLLDEFESGGWVGPGVRDVAVDAVTERDAAPEFVVEEPQVVVPDELAPAWTRATETQVPEGARAPDEQYADAPDWRQLAEAAAADQPAGRLVDEQPQVEVVTPGYDLPTPTFDPEPARFEAQPTSYDAAPIGAVPARIPEPVETGMQESDPGAEPVGFAPEAHDAGALPCAVEASVIPPEPELEPAAEAFAWSPWAQEMGLGEPSADSIVEAAQAQDYAKMMAEDQSAGHTEDFPTPQSPTAGAAPGGIALAAEPQAAVSAGLPQPRQPGDAFPAEPAATSPLGTHALAGAVEPNAPAAPPTPVPELGGSAPQGEPADPLAGGLLAHLMSSVRGL